MVMSRKLIIRITEQQFRNLSNSLISDQNGEPTITKSLLLRGILDEYFEKNCRGCSTKDFSEDNQDIVDKDNTIHNKPEINKIK